MRVVPWLCSIQTAALMVVSVIFRMCAIMVYHALSVQNDTLTAVPFQPLIPCINDRYKNKYELKYVFSLLRTFMRRGSFYIHFIFDSFRFGVQWSKWGPGSIVYNTRTKLRTLVLVNYILVVAFYSRHFMIAVLFVNLLCRNTVLIVNHCLAH